MALNINDRDMTSDRTPHAARLAPGQEHQWEVSWLPGRRMTRNEAVTAMTLAEACRPAGTSEPNRLRPHIQGWAAEPGLTAGQAVTQVAARPAWTVTAEPAPGPADPEAGE
jgi:hypothetical protein